MPGSPDGAHTPTAHPCAPGDTGKSMHHRSWPRTMRQICGGPFTHLFMWPFRATYAMLRREIGHFIRANCTRSNMQVITRVGGDSSFHIRASRHPISRCMALGHIAPCIARLPWESASAFQELQAETYLLYPVKMYSLSLCHSGNSSQVSVLLRAFPGMLVCRTSFAGGDGGAFGSLMTLAYITNRSEILTSNGLSTMARVA